MKVTRKVEEWGKKSYIMVLRFFFAVRSTIHGAEVAFLSFDQRRYGGILFQTCTSKIDFRSPRFHVLQFSHYCTPLVAPPSLSLSLNHVLYLDTKLKHGPQKVITRVSSTAETIINWFTSHIFLHFTEHPLLSYISVVCETKCHSGLPQTLYTVGEHPLLSGTVR
jgi:hypothetical protein